MSKIRRIPKALQTGVRRIRRGLATRVMKQGINREIRLTKEAQQQQNKAERLWDQAKTREQTLARGGYHPNDAQRVLDQVNAMNSEAFDANWKSSDLLAKARRTKRVAKKIGRVVLGKSKIFRLPAEKQSPSLGRRMRKIIALMQRHPETSLKYAQLRQRYNQLSKEATRLAIRRKK